MGNVKRAGEGVGFANPHWAVTFDGGRVALGRLTIEPEIVLRTGTQELSFSARDVQVSIEDGVLARIVVSGQSPRGDLLRLTYDVHETENLHLYVRLEWGQPIEGTSLELPRLRIAGIRQVTFPDAATVEPPAEMHVAEPWLQLRGDSVLGIGITKMPWQASWNDIGATGYRTFGNTRVAVAQESVSLCVPGPFSATAGETIEAALIFRPIDESVEDLRYQCTHDDPREVVYIPHDEWAHFMSRQIEDRWLGPPIMGGCPGRPADQLIPRSLGMDILAHRRFSWNNEDLSLWRITGKSLYRDIAIKKAYGLLAAQNEHGGWFEGVEFYNLPPRHHQHYNSYTSFVYLIDAFDVTGEQRFLDAALRSKDFWFGPPPANSHSKDAADAWWYRWGGYINAAGYTDERHALNTHASVLMIFSLLWSRIADAEAKRGLEYGVNAFKRALSDGLQRPSGQFLYSLSQVDPRYERPGDPPYIQDDLIPEIENVYTVLSAFRLLVANRVQQDPVVAESCARALAYFWQANRAGRASTYRSYPVKTFGIAAGDVDLRFAFALPYLLRDPDNWTSIYRGFSAWVAPSGGKGLLVEPHGRPAGLESVFLSRTEDDFTFAVVNVGPPLAPVPIAVELDERAAGSTVELRDPGGQHEGHHLPSHERDGRLDFELADLGEGEVRVVRLRSGKG